MDYAENERKFDRECRGQQPMFVFYVVNLRRNAWFSFEIHHLLQWEMDRTWTIQFLMGFFSIVISRRSGKKERCGKCRNVGGWGKCGDWMACKCHALLPPYPATRTPSLLPCTAYALVPLPWILSLSPPPPPLQTQHQELRSEPPHFP